MKLGKVFEKLLFISFIILTIAFILVTTFVSSIFSRQFIEIRYNELRNEAAIINFCENASSSSQESFLLSEIKSAAERYNAVIWIVDKDKNITKIGTKDSVTANNGKLEEETVQYFNSVMNGEDLERIGSFGKSFDNVMTYGTKLVVNNQTIGVIFIHADLQELQTYLNSITGQVIISAIASLAVAIILIYSMAQYFTKPLILMNDYARKVAKGNFGLQLNIKQNDEVGQLAESFNLMAQELKSIDDNRKRFIGNVSHELRSPLASIHGYVHGLIDGTIDKSQSDKYLGIVLSESHRLNMLINDLLDLSKIDSGVYPFHKTKFNLTRLVEKVIKIYEGTAEKKSIEFVKIVSSDQLDVFGDVDRITQVLNNLIDNAIKFSSNYSKIHVILTKKGNSVNVEIKDSGPGLTAEDAINIWQPFFQVDQARTPNNARGTGLGLFIAKSILEQHGVDIGVKSAPGEGATFYFSLPCDDSGD